VATSHPPKIEFAFGTPSGIRATAKEFEKESDRAVVVLGAAKLDNLLYQLLAARLIPCSSGDDELLDGDRPLSTFSSRINIAYRLGLITHNFAKALHLVRKLRNDFAHEYSGISIAAGPQRDRIDALIHPLRSNWAFLWILKTYFGDGRSESVLFRAAVTLMALRLLGQLEVTVPIDGDEAMEMMPAPETTGDKKPDPPATPSSPA